MISHHRPLPLLQCSPFCVYYDMMCRSITLLPSSYYRPSSYPFLLSPHPFPSTPSSSSPPSLPPSLLLLITSFPPPPFLPFHPLPLPPPPSAVIDWNTSKFAAAGQQPCMIYAAQFSKEGGGRYIVAGGSGANEAKVFDHRNGNAVVGTYVCVSGSSMGVEWILCDVTEG